MQAFGQAGAADRESVRFCGAAEPAVTGPRRQQCTSVEFCRSATFVSVQQARFIATARREFLAEVIYYNREQSGPEARFVAAAPRNRREHPHAVTAIQHAFDRHPHQFHGRPEQCEIWSMMFAIKAEVSDPSAETFEFTAQKTMYAGKHIAEGDTIFVFASENQGGPGLIARGIVTSARAMARERGVVRQTPRVSLSIGRTALAKRRLGRSELKSFSDWDDGRPETELNFKFYRQATNKIVGISDEAAAFLRGFF